MKRTFIRQILVAAALMFVGALSFAQSLGVGAVKPLVDGVINAKEYGYTKDFGQMTLYFQRTSDTLFIGVVGKTSGWVAVGLDSLKMDSAPIFMGFVLNGKAQFKTQIGSGHTHRDSDAEIAASVLSSAMKEEGGNTVLELELKSSPYISKDQKELAVIYAMGAPDVFTQQHSFRGAMKVPLS
jgi:hypothetical protein